MKQNKRYLNALKNASFITKKRHLEDNRERTSWYRSL